MEISCAKITCSHVYEYCKVIGAALHGCMAYYGCTLYSKLLKVMGEFLVYYKDTVVLKEALGLRIKEGASADSQ